MKIAEMIRRVLAARGIREAAAVRSENDSTPVGRCRCLECEPYRHEA